MTPFNMKLLEHSERAVRDLERSGDYRVLKRLPRIDEVWCRSAPVANPATTITLAVVDTETSGLDSLRHMLLEIGIVKMQIDCETGELLSIDEPLSWLEDPREPIAEDIEELTGLTNATLAGQRFDDQAIAAVLADVNCIVAHNAKFDLGFFQARFPQIMLPWACSCNEVQWAEHGLGRARSVGSLLAAAGMFADIEHRAGSDAWCVAMLLAMSGCDGMTIAWHLVRHAQRPTYRLIAWGAPIAVKDTLKSAGYRWCPTRRAWWFESDPERIDHERNWLVSLCPGVKPEIETITWFDRHAR
jgi:DNA polymerase III subunit epsilon